MVIAFYSKSAGRPTYVAEKTALAVVSRGCKPKVRPKQGNVMRMKNLAVSLIAALALCGLTSASAAVITITFTEAGWYDETGFHDQTNPSYLAGEIFVTPREALFNDFFTFNLPAISGTIVGAQLRILNPVFASGDLTETPGIFYVS